MTKEVKSKVYKAVKGKDGKCMLVKKRRDEPKKKKVKKVKAPKPAERKRGPAFDDEAAAVARRKKEKEKPKDKPKENITRFAELVKDAEDLLKDRKEERETKTKEKTKQRTKTFGDLPHTGKVQLIPPKFTDFPQAARAAGIKGKGKKLDKAKATLKKFAIPISGLAAATIIGIAAALNNNKDKGEAFMFHSLSDLSPEEFKRLMEPEKKPDSLIYRGNGEPKERPKRRKANDWIKHCKRYAEKHNLSWRDALKGAGATYQKPKK